MTKKTRLFFDATPLVDAHISGVGKVLQETLKALDTSTYAAQYTIYLFVPFDEARKARALGYTYIKVKLLPYPHRFLSLFARMKFSPPIDIFLGKGIYIFENFRNWNVAFSKSITYIHDVSFRIYPEFVQERNLAYLQKYVTMWMNRTDRIVTVSDSSKKEVVEEFAVDNVSIIANAVDTAVFYPRSKTEIKSVRQKWKIPEKYMLFIGNIEPRKNLVTTIKAFRQYVAATGSDDALVIIGGGGWRNEAIIKEIEMARDAGIVIIRPDGYVPDDDLPALISGARALLQFSWHEGFGLPVLQAIACGTPVAASDIPSLHEAAGAYESRVVYAPANSPEALSQAIDHAVRMPHEKQAPAHVRTWDDAAGDLLSIVDELATNDNL